MSRKLIEDWRIDLLHFDSTGDTVGTNITPYYDMKGYDRAELLVASRHLPVTATGADRTVSVNVYLATDCSGGGAQSMSSATSLLGFSSLSSAGGATNYINELTIRWNTAEYYDDATVTTFELICGTATAAFVTSSAASIAMSYVCAGASANASCAAAGFIAGFNNTAINTSTAFTANWVAEEPSEATVAGVADVRIRRKNPDSTLSISFQQDGTNTHTKFGYNMLQHLAVPVEMMGEHRFIAAGLCSTDEPSAYSVTLFRHRSGEEVRRLEGRGTAYEGGINESKDLANDPGNWSKPA